MAEALYSMPRNNQLGLGGPRSPPSSMPFNSYTGQLAVSVQDAAASQWTEGKDIIEIILLKRYACSNLGHSNES